MPKGVSIPAKGKFEMKEVGESFDVILECIGEEVFQSLPCVHMEPFGYGLTLFVQSKSGIGEKTELPVNVVASSIAQTEIRGNAFLINETVEGMPLDLSLDDLKRMLEISRTEFSSEKVTERKKTMVAKTIEELKAIREQDPKLFEFMMEANCGKDWKDFQ